MIPSEPEATASLRNADNLELAEARKAAKEYEAMVKKQEYARGAVDVVVAAAEDLLAVRTQARSDADLIKRVHQL